MELSGFLRGRALRKTLHRLLFSFALLLVAVAPLGAEGPKPKLGPHAIPIQQSREYFRTNDASDYWALSPYYVPQASNSACSLAAVAMLVNALKGLPAFAHESLLTQPALRDAVGSTWASKTAEGGDGVTWEEFKQFLRLALQAFALDGQIETFKPPDTSQVSLDELRRLLSENERSDDDIALIYFNQGVITGDWDGPHLSPIGAYDAERSRVLVMDVDRQFYGPYWTSDEKLLEALVRPAPAGHGALAGETGGVVRVTVRRANTPSATDSTRKHDGTQAR